MNDYSQFYVLLCLASSVVLALLHDHRGSLMCPVISSHCYCQPARYKYLCITSSVIMMNDYLCYLSKPDNFPRHPFYLPIYNTPGKSSIQYCYWEIVAWFAGRQSDTEQQPIRAQRCGVAGAATQRRLGTLSRRQTSAWCWGELRWTSRDSDDDYMRCCREWGIDVYWISAVNSHGIDLVLAGSFAAYIPSFMDSRAALLTQSCHGTVLRIHSI